MDEMGVYWGVALALASIETIIALAILYFYLPMAAKARSMYPLLPAVLASALLLHGVASLLAGITMVRAGLGSEIALALIPVYGLGALIAGIVLLIAKR